MRISRRRLKGSHRTDRVTADRGSETRGRRLLGSAAIAGDTGVPNKQRACWEQNRPKKWRAGVLASAAGWMAVHAGSLGIGQCRCWRRETKSFFQRCALP